jgi:hypothetical protein
MAFAIPVMMLNLGKLEVIFVMFEIILLKFNLEVMILNLDFLEVMILRQ